VELRVNSSFQHFEEIIDHEPARNITKIGRINMKFDTGDSVIIVLRDPREKLLGVLDEINAAGITMRGIDLSYYDDWVQSIVKDEPYLPMNDYFLPMWRVERVMRDESSGEVGSMAEQFEKRTGKRLDEF
jgi:hypothetical protein